MPQPVAVVLRAKLSGACSPRQPQERPCGRLLDARPAVLCASSEKKESWKALFLTARLDSRRTNWQSCQCVVKPFRANDPNSSTTVPFILKGELRHGRQGTEGQGQEEEDRRQE